MRDVLELLVERTPIRPGRNMDFNFKARPRIGCSRTPNFWRGTSPRPTSWLFRFQDSVRIWNSDLPGARESMFTREDGQKSRKFSYSRSRMYWHYGCSVLRRSVKLSNSRGTSTNVKFGRRIEPGSARLDVPSFWFPAAPWGFFFYCRKKRGAALRHGLKYVVCAAEHNLRAVVRS
jgi:hypothetical protein